MQFPYKPLYKPNQLICGTGQTAIVTGWTVKHAVAKHLQTHEYAAIGQLYSPTRGLSFLIRNLLANPQVRYVVILNATREDRNAGACHCLLDFFRHGFTEGTSDTGRPCWVISSHVDNRPMVGYLDREIEADALDQLRRLLTVREARSIAEAVQLTQAYSQQPPLAPWGAALAFPLAETESQARLLPGPRYGHRIEGSTIAETWVKIIHRIRTTGVTRPTGYDGQWQELIDLVAVVTDEPPEFYFPEPNYLPCDRPFIEHYIAQILEDAPQQEGVKYTYGQRLRSWFGRDQVQQVIQKLVTDINSARTVMSLWDVGDHDANESPPCLNHLWVRVIDQELSLTATFRSNDMFSAWPANAIGLRALQHHICDQVAAAVPLHLHLGPLIIVSQSSHIYDDCWENADQLIRSQYPRICQRRDYTDPAGSFVISLQDGEILVEHMTPGSGEVVNCYCGKSAHQLYRQIAAHSPSLQVDHALYLGTELQKAELALTLPEQFRYEQDRSLIPTGNTSPSPDFAPP